MSNVRTKLVFGSNRGHRSRATVIVCLDHGQKLSGQVTECSHGESE